MKAPLYDFADPPFASRQPFFVDWSSDRLAFVGSSLVTRTALRISPFLLWCREGTALSALHRVRVTTLRQTDQAVASLSPWKATPACGRNRHKRPAAPRLLPFCSQPRKRREDCCKDAPMPVLVMKFGG